MIEQLEIKNFRGFSEYKIEDVGQVNLLVGTNNCGKTSILEAVHLLKSRGDVSILFSLFAHRGERIQNEDQRIPEAEGDLRRLFYGFQLRLESNLIIKNSGRKPEKVHLSVHEIQTIPQLELFKEFSESTGRYLLNAEWGDQHKTAKQDFPISHAGGLSFDIARIPYARLRATHDVNVEFVPSSSLSPQEIVSLFDKIVLTPDEDLVLEAVKIVEPNIIRLASLGGGERYYQWGPGEYARGGIIVKSDRWEKPIPIGNFGDGIWRLLGLILSLVGAKNGTLLIDEIDTGLHHTVMSKMWKLICTTARKLNVQVFATTHSSDCWKTLADNAVEEEFADMPIRIHRIDKNKTRPETFTNMEMHLAVNQEIEVR